MRTQPRAVPDLNDHKHVHHAARRRAAKPPIMQSDYWPTAKLSNESIVTRVIGAKRRWCRTGIFLEKGITYQFEAEGEWLDKHLKSGPEGLPNSLKSIGHAVSAGVGKLKRTVFRIESNEPTKATLSRRQDQWPWFALVGVIVNGDRNPRGGVPIERDTEPPMHQPFLIGTKSGPITPKSSGYLYCYANDAWHFYGNNRGKVLLRIRRD
jgi:hypothetical protein